MPVDSDSLQVTAGVAIPLAELSIEPVRASGPGGQNVNKTASAVHLRFDVGASSLPDACKARLLAMRDRRITRRGVVVIKAQEHRHQEANRAAAIRRLIRLVETAAKAPDRRIPTRPSAAARRRRLAGKRKRSLLKARRQPPADGE